MSGYLVTNLTNFNNIPENATHLTFDWFFNKSLTIENLGIIPRNVTHLHFVNYVILEMGSIPKSVTHLNFNNSFNLNLALSSGLIPESVIYINDKIQFHHIVNQYCKK